MVTVPHQVMMTDATADLARGIREQMERDRAPVIGTQFVEPRFWLYWCRCCDLSIIVDRLTYWPLEMMPHTCCDWKAHGPSRVRPATPYDRPSVGRL